MGRRIRALLDAPVHPGSLVAFRIAFGLLLTLQVVRYFAHGWIDAQFHAPAVLFPWEGFGWASPWPRPWMHVHFAAMGVLAACFAAGIFFRTSAVLLGAAWTWMHALDGANYLNHYYLISLVLGISAFLPLGRAGSLDVRWRGIPALREFRGWTLALLRFQVGLVYVFAGLAKLQPDWLFDAQPLRLWLAQRSDWPLMGKAMTAYVFAWAGAAFDLALPFALLIRRARPWALGTALIFHVATALLFPIGLFPWIMLAALTVFLPPDWPARWMRFPAAPIQPNTGRGVAVALALYAVLQVAIPLRFLLVPGNVLWTERGMRFSWRVMIAEKVGVVRLEARPRDGRPREGVRLRDYVTAAQERWLSTQPDLIRDLAVRVGRERGAAVYADAWVSLNGRPSRRLIDPRADLAGALSPGWILPEAAGSLSKEAP